MAAPLSPSGRWQEVPAQQPQFLMASDALVLEYLPLAIAERLLEAGDIASAVSRRLLPRLESEDVPRH